MDISVYVTLLFSSTIHLDLHQWLHIDECSQILGGLTAANHLNGLQSSSSAFNS